MFRYDAQVMPPAPFVETQVINPLTEETLQLPGKLDTGAAMTVIPFILTLNGKDLTFELQDP